MGSHSLLKDLHDTDWAGLDPGNGKTILVEQWNEQFNIVTSGIETRVVGAPEKANMACTITLVEDGGDLTLTVTGGYNDAGSTTIVMDDAGDFVTLFSIQVGSAFYWREWNSNGVQSHRSAGCVCVAASDSSDADKAASGYFCDGVADDVQINAALTSGAARVFLAEGTYLIAGTILVPSNTELFGAGPGTIIKLRAAGEAGLTAYTILEVLGAGAPTVKAMLISDQAAPTTGIYLHDFTVDGNGASIVAADYKISFAGIALYDCQYSLVERVNVYDCNHLIAAADIDVYRSFCILIAKAEHITVRDGTWGDCGYESIGIRGATSDILIDGCRIVRHATFNPGYGRHGIQVSAPSGYTAKNVTICNTYHYGIKSWIIVHGGTDVSIIGCNFRIISGGGAVLTGEFGITLNLCDNVTIESCRFFGTAPATTDMIEKGIYLLGSATEYPQNVTISNCIAFTGGHCIDISAGVNINVVNCHLKSGRRRCVEVIVDAPADDLANILIAGNHCTTTAKYDGNSQPINVVGVARAVIRDNVLSAPVDVAACYLNNAANVMFENNMMTYSGSGVGLSINGTTSVKAAGNVGFVDAASGTATVANGQTTVDVTHGLGFTPNAAQVICNPTNNLGNAAMFWLSDLGATTFRINVDADPGAGTATFSWQARMDV